MLLRWPQSSAVGASGVADGAGSGADFARAGRGVVGAFATGVPVAARALAAARASYLAARMARWASSLLMS